MQVRLWARAGHYVARLDIRRCGLSTRLFDRKPQHHFVAANSLRENSIVVGQVHQLTA